MTPAGKEHWDAVYQRLPPDAVSWYRAHLDRSLELIERVAPRRSAAIIDVGGGESTLVDDLLARDYSDVTVLDISSTAIDGARARLGDNAGRVSWLVCDVTEAALPARRYDLWHDRAVFHFLTQPSQRSAYVRQVARSIRPGGHVIVATFGPEGPEKCSGLDVVRYDSHALHEQFGARFTLLESSTELHQTPSGKVQQFLYCMCAAETEP